MKKKKREKGRRSAPSELRKAHRDNDRVVMEAYGFTKDTEAYTSEAVCVAELMKMYQRLTGENKI